MNQTKYPNNNKCPDCGTDNKQSANYCSICGIKLPDSISAASMSDKKKKNNIFLKFPNQRLSLSHASKKGAAWADFFTRSPLRSIISVLIVSFLLVLSLLFLFDPRFRQSASKIDRKNSNPAIEDSLRVIASNFVCNCGKCGRENIMLCKCEYAVKERNFIRNLLVTSKDKQAIISEVNQEFGGLIQK